MFTFFFDLRSSAMFDNSELSTFFIIRTINLPFTKKNLISIEVLLQTMTIQRPAWPSASTETY